MAKQQEILKQEDEIVTTQAVAIAGSPEIDMQITTAKKYPREIDECLVEAEKQATIDEETAASMSYALPRGGKTIEGPSVRLAEIFASAWGNLRAESHILDADNTHVTSEAMCWDLEKNVAIRCQVKRRIVDRRGMRYNADMITTTGNAAASVAFRNAVFKVIPKSYVDKVRRKALAVSVGDAANLTEMRTKAFGAFHRFGVTDEQILETLGRPAIEDVNIDDIGKLRKFFTAIKEDGIDVSTIFKPIESATAKKKREALTEKIKKSKQPDAESDAFEQDDIADSEDDRLF